MAYLNCWLCLALGLIASFGDVLCGRQRTDHGPPKGGPPNPWYPPGNQGFGDAPHDDHLPWQPGDSSEEDSNTVPSEMSTTASGGIRSDGGSVSGPSSGDGDQNGISSDREPSLQSDADFVLQNARNVHNSEHADRYGESDSTALGSSLLVGLLIVSGIVVIIGITVVTLCCLKESKRSTRQVGQKPQDIDIYTLESMPPKQHPPKLDDPLYDDNPEKRDLTKCSIKDGLFLSYNLSTAWLAREESEVPPKEEQTPPELSELPPVYLFNPLPPAYTRMDMRESSSTIS